MLGVHAQVHYQFDGLVELGEVSLLQDFGGFRQPVGARLHLLAGFLGVFSDLASHLFLLWPSTSMPLLRAVPITVRTADSRLVVLKCTSLVCAISSTCFFFPLL